MSARVTYVAGRDAADKVVRAREARASAIGLARVAVAFSALVLVAFIVWAPLPGWAWSGVAALVLTFAALVVVHGRVLAQRELAAAARRFYERGLGRLDGKWNEFSSTGKRFETPDHLYAEDLDVFGRASLFQLLDATETRFGEERLAAWLAGPRIKVDVEAWRSALAARQDAVKDLAPRVAFRERLASLGVALGDATTLAQRGDTKTDKPDLAAFIAWAEGAHPLHHGPALRWMALALPAVAVALIAFTSLLGLPTVAWVAVVAAEVAIGAALRSRTAPVTGAASAREHGLSRYGAMFAAIEAESFVAPALGELQGRLRASGAEVTREMAALARIVGFVDARQNEVFRIFIAPVLMWDLNCAIALERWRLRAGKSVRAWFEALGDLEALSSLAGFTFERPDHVWPELAKTLRLEAKALGHPLIPQDRRIANDIVLSAPGSALVVTGSNMSGKSTLLRAVGINAVLALAGAPVSARSFVMGPLVVATSMRVRDSLEEGVSRFYAELQKLKRVIDVCRSESSALFLLDEILHGTNSRERLIGARAIVRELLARGAIGAVSTHDLGIGDLATELAGRVLNVHFEEQVAKDDTMTFDYKLKPGIVQSSNALRLMKIVGIDVVE